MMMVKSVIAMVTVMFLIMIVVVTMMIFMRWWWCFWRYRMAETGCWLYSITLTSAILWISGATYLTFQASLFYLELCILDCAHGRCHRQQCICEEGWTGELCNVAQCDNRCTLNGQCNNGTCLCNTGWNGKHCTVGESSNSLLLCLIVTVIVITNLYSAVSREISQRYESTSLWWVSLEVVLCKFTVTITVTVAITSTITVTIPVTITVTVTRWQSDMTLWCVLLLKRGSINLCRTYVCIYVCVFVCVCMRVCVYSWVYASSLGCLPSD